MVTIVYVGNTSSALFLSPDTLPIFGLSLVNVLSPSVYDPNFRLNLQSWNETELLFPLSFFISHKIWRLTFLMELTWIDSHPTNQIVGLTKTNISQSLNQSIWSGLVQQDFRSSEIPEIPPFFVRGITACPEPYWNKCYGSTSEGSHFEKFLFDCDASRKDGLWRLFFGRFGWFQLHLPSILLGLVLAFLTFFSAIYFVLGLISGYSVIACSILGPQSEFSRESIFLILVVVIGIISLRLLRSHLLSMMFVG
jgi:hypothetical protein